MGTPAHPLRAYRLRQSPPVTLKNLAERVGTTKATLSRIETGKHINMSKGLLEKVISETGLSAAILRPDLASLFAAGKPQKRRRRAA
jgi:transcriptional regulator with XRE-family HTH domain